MLKIVQGKKSIAVTICFGDEIVEILYKNPLKMVKKMKDPSETWERL